MDWLKEILEKADITEGKLNIEAIMALVNKEFPNHAVPKNVFNDKNEELKTANETISELKEENTGNKGLQKKVADYEIEVQRLKTEQETTKKEYVLREAIGHAGAVDAEYVIFKQGGVDKFSFDKDGKPIGIDDIVKPLKESAPHLFKAEPGTDYKPNSGGNPPANNPWAKDTINLTEQGKILNANPAQAKALAAAAGVTI